MNRHNARINAFALQQLKVDKTERVLEIGFGGGVTLPHLLENAGFVAGLDRSADVVERAQSRFSRAVASGEAAFQVGAVESLPYELGSFEKILTVNTVYFWKSLDEGFGQIHRVLVPGGSVVTGFFPREFMDRMGLPPDIFSTRTVDEVVAALRRVGFAKVCVTRPQMQTAWTVLVASEE